MDERELFWAVKMGVATGVRRWLAGGGKAAPIGSPAGLGSSQGARALARVLLALGRIDEAEHLAVEARAAAPSTEIDLLLSEILFRQGRWRELQEVSRDAVAAGRADELLRWWSGEPAA